MTLNRKPAEEGGYSTLRRSRKPSKRSKDPVLPEVYDTVMRRDRHCIAHPQLGKDCGGRAIWHHRLPVEHGGRSTVENGARVCNVHHDRLHRYRRLAHSLGILVPKGADPATTPLTLPTGRVVLLTADGHYEEVA